MALQMGDFCCLVHLRGACQPLRQHSVFSQPCRSDADQVPSYPWLALSRRQEGGSCPRIWLLVTVGQGFTAQDLTYI